MEVVHYLLARFHCNSCSNNVGICCSSTVIHQIENRRQRRLKYLLALKKIQHLSRLLDLVEPKFGKVKKSDSKFKSRITKPQLTWKQHADVVYLYLHLCLGIEMFTSGLECSKCNYPNFCSAPSNFVIGLNLRLTNSAPARFPCYAFTHRFCILLYHYFIMSTFVHQLLQKPPQGPCHSVTRSVIRLFFVTSSVIYGNQVHYSLSYIPN